MAKQSVILRTPVFRMSYPNLITPRRFKDPKNQKERGDATYSVDMLLEPEDLENFWQAVPDGYEPTDSDEVKDGFRKVDIRLIMRDVVRAELGSTYDVKAAVAAKRLIWPIRNGDDIAAQQKVAGKPHADAYEGKRVIRIKSLGNKEEGKDYPPRLVIVDRGEYRTLDMDVPVDKRLAEQKFRGGNYAIASINVAAGSTPSDYVTCYCNSVLYLKDGKPLGGMDNVARFGGITGGEHDYDPTGGKEPDDDIPF